MIVHCYCYQKLPGVKLVPVRVRVMDDLGSRMRVRYKGGTYVVNAAACSTRKPPGKPRKTWREPCQYE